MDKGVVVKMKGGQILIGLFYIIDRKIEICKS